MSAFRAGGTNDRCREVYWRSEISQMREGVVLKRCEQGDDEENQHSDNRDNADAGPNRLVASACFCVEHSIEIL